MEQINQLKCELDEAIKRKVSLQEKMNHLNFCIDVLQKEVAYRVL